MKPATHWSYATAFTLLRIYTGVFWLAHGVPKFLDSASFMPPDGFMPQLVQHGATSLHGFYGDFLRRVVVPHVWLFAQLVRLGEVLAGCSLLFGFLSRFGGLVGCFLALNYLASKGGFTSWTDAGTIDAVAFVLSFCALALPLGRVFGVDALLTRRPAPATRPVTSTPATGDTVIVPEFVDEPPAPPRP